MCFFEIFLGGREKRDHIFEIKKKFWKKFLNFFYYFNKKIFWNQIFHFNVGFLLNCWKLKRKLIFRRERIFFLCLIFEAFEWMKFSFISGYILFWLIFLQNLSEIPLIAYRLIQKEKFYLLGQKIKIPYSILTNLNSLFEKVLGIRIRETLK